MKTILKAAAAALMIAVAAPALAQQMTAQDFVAEAASSDMFEIRSSEFALDRAQSEEVRAFADMMIADHSQASENLMSAAEAAGVAVPAEMLEKHRAQVEQLEPLEGEAFDEAYIQAQLTAHEEALALMHGYAEGGDQEALREHAAATTPVIEGHLEHVRQLAGN